MRLKLIFQLCFLLLGCHLVEGNRRILTESSYSSTRWQFDQFSTQVEQNMQTIVIPNQQLLFVQSQVDENELKSIILQKYDRNEIKIGKELKFGDLDTECSRPKVVLINNIGFALSWIQKQTDQTKLYIQIINFDLEPITSKQEISDIHLEVHWDFVSEFHYIQYINETKVLILYKGPNQTKIWKGTVFDFQNNTKTAEIQLCYSKQVSIAVNQLYVIVLIQMIEDTQSNQVTILNYIGQIQRTFKLYKYYNEYVTFQPKITALSNNNFILVQPYYDWITLYVYDNRFQTILNNNYNYYYYSKDIPPAVLYFSWNYYGNFRNGLIQLQALEDSFVIAGVDINNFIFSIVHVKNNNLEFIQQRIINYEDLNIYSYSIQKTDRNSVFIQWIDGLPETLIPQQKQNLYLSELNLQLNIDDCGVNCDTCENNICKTCKQNYTLVENNCQPKCTQNCKKCSNSIACEICQNGFVLTNMLECVENNDIENGEFRVSLSETTFKENAKFKLLPDRRIIIIYQEENQDQQFIQIKVLNAQGTTILSQSLEGEDVLDFDLFLKENVLNLILMKQMSNKVGIYYYQLQISDLQQIRQIQLQIQDNQSIYRISQSMNVFTVLETKETFTIFIQGAFNDFLKQNILSYTYDYNGNFKNQFLYGEIYLGNAYYNQRKKIFDAAVDNLGNIIVILTSECEAQLYVLDQYGQLINQRYQSYNNYWSCRYLQNPSISIVPTTNQIMIAVQDLNNQFYVFNWQEDVIYKSQFDQNSYNPQLKALNSNSFILIYEEYHLDANFKTLNYLHYEDGQIKSKKILNQNSIQPEFVEIISLDQNYLYFSMIAFRLDVAFVTNQVYLQQIFIPDDKLIGLIKICDERCSQCDNNLVCSQCQENYILDSQNKCQLVCLANCSKCEKVNQCEICNEGYQINNDRQCTQDKLYPYIKLQDHLNRIESNSQIAVAKNGNMIIVWMEYDTYDGRYYSFYKVFNSQGVQIRSEQIIENDNIVLPKIKNFGEFFILSVVRTYGEILINILDSQGNFVTYWRSAFQSNIYQYTEITQFQYDIATNGQYHIFIVAQNFISQDNFKLMLIRFGFIYFKNELNQELIKEYNNYNQRIKNLEIQVDANFVYFQFLNNQIDPNGFNKADTLFVQVNYNFDVQKKEEIGWDSFYKILTSQSKIQITRYEIDFEIIFYQYDSIIQRQHIQTGMTIESIRAATYQDSILVLWIGRETDQRKMFLQQFQKNGIILSGQIQLPQFSNQPSNPQIGCLENGDIIITWQESDTLVYTVFAVKFNKHLQLIPLTSVICMQNCETCMATTQCSRCSQGYYFDGVQCKLQCEPSCQLCQVKYTCDVCQPGYYLQDQYCKYDSNMFDEHRIAKIEDQKSTPVSISSFSDSSFVIVWNDKLNSIQTLHYQFYDSNKQKQGEIRTVISQNDRQYAQTASLANDQFAVVWFDGDCNVQCRLLFQIYNKDLVEQISEITIDSITLPNLYEQKPVVIKRQENRLIVAYISYKDSQTYGYYAIYEIDNILMLNPQIIEDSNRVDNLDIIIYNPQIYIILYVSDGKQLKALRVEKDVGQSNIKIYESGNSLYTPTHVVNSCGNIVLAWTESILENNQYVKQIMLGFIDSYINIVAGNIKIQFYIMEQLENPILLGNSECSSFSVFAKSSDFLTQTKKRIMFSRFDNYQGISNYQQLKSYVYDHTHFQIQQLQHQDYILVDVGLSSDIQQTIFMMRVDGNGNQMKLNQVVCLQYCQECNNSHSCLKCQDGYWIFDNKCIKVCPNHADYCDEFGKIICSKGFKLDSFNQCIPEDPELTQQLINTQQFRDQYNQNIATLSNGNSIVVWSSQGQTINGLSIYMQLFDTSFQKIGAETLITKDSVGVQENPNVVALLNNEFLIIWKDSNPSNILRILMQKFSINFERLGNEIVVYDSATSDLLLYGFSQVYESYDSNILHLSNNNLAVVLAFRSISGQIDIRLKLFDQNLMEFKSISIGQGQCCSQNQIQLTQIDSAFYVIWKNNQNKVQIVTISFEGDIINGHEFENSQQQFGYIDSSYQQFSLTKNELNQLVIALSDYQSIQIQIYDQQFQKIGDQVTIKTEFYVELISICQVQGGIIMAYKYKQTTPLYETQSIDIKYFDNNLVSQKNLFKQLNDYNGQIQNIKMSYTGNNQFIVTWTQYVYGRDDYYLKSERDTSLGLYAKRLDTNGNILKISNVICQSNCNKCSKQNLCESCNEGFQFDYTKSICMAYCPQNCKYCYSEYFRPSFCYECQSGYNLNQQGQCEKAIIKDKQNLYQIGTGELSYQVQDFVTLQNGNIVIIFHKERKELYFKLINNQGEIVIEQQYIYGTSGSEEIVRITALSNGHFAIVHRSFNTNSNNQIYLHIYDQNGREIRSFPIISFALWNYYYWWYSQSYNFNLLAIKSLSDGGFAITYMNDNNGFQFTRPQIFLRIYNNKFFQITNDIPLSTQLLQDLYWEWWNNNNLISILETENHLIVTNNFQRMQWDYKFNFLQINQIDKNDYSITNKLIDFNQLYLLIYDNPWWWQDISGQIYQIKKDEYIIFKILPFGILRFDFDKDFTLIKTQMLKQNQLNFNYDYTCPACCVTCWNYNQIQILQLDRSFVLSYFTNIKIYYYSQRVLKLLPFNFNFEKLSSIKDVTFYQNDNKFVSYQRNGIIKKYLNNNILVMQQIYLEIPQKNLYIVFEKQDYKCNKLQMWEEICLQNCLSCINVKNSIQQCLICESDYYLDDQQQCQLTCQFDHCLYCQNSGTKQQYCQICENGYRIKDNSQCVLDDPNLIVEKELGRSQEKEYILPRVKALTDGTILVVTLQFLKDQMVLYGQTHTQNGENSSDLQILAQSTSIGYFDFSTSSQDEIILIWVDQTNLIQVRAQKFDKQLQKVGSEFVVYDQIIDQRGSQFATVEYLVNDEIAILLFGNNEIYMKKYDVNNLGSNIQYVGLFYQDFWNWYQQWQQTYIEFYPYQIEYWFKREPSIVSTKDHIFVVFLEFQKVRVQVFDYSLSIYNSLTFDSVLPSQPSAAKIENGNIVIVWIDKIQSNTNLSNYKEVKSYQQYSIAYAIFDPYLNSVKFNYFGMDSVRELKPDIGAIPNGFVITFTGISESNYRNIDLRVVYFDLNGNQQSGFIPISFKCQEPKNPTITSFQDGSIIVTWNQGSQIYAQKLNRDGVIQPFNSILCPNLCKKCTKSESCDTCFDGYLLNNINQCQPICLIPNCYSCTYWSDRCYICNKGYSLDEINLECKINDNTNNQEFVLQNNVQSQTLIVQNSIGQIIHLWLDYNQKQLLAQSFTADGSQVFDPQSIMSLQYSSYDVFTAAYHKESNYLVVLLGNYEQQIIVYFKDSFEQIPNTIILNDLLKSEFIYLQIQNTKLYTYSGGLILQVFGDRKVVIDKFSPNPQLRICQVPELILLDLQGNQLVPSIIFQTSEKKLQNIFLDQNNNCYNWYVNDILINDYIYVILFDLNTGKQWIQKYDFVGKMQIEKNLGDFLPTYMNYGKIKILNGELFIFAGYNSYLRMSPSMDVIDNQDLPLMELYMQNAQIVRINYSQITYIFEQNYFDQKRYKFVIYDYQMKFIVFQELISPTSQFQGQFTYLTQQNEDLLFSWLEQGYNNENQGKVMILKIGLNGQKLKFQDFSCLPICKECTAINRCQSCIDDYDLVNQKCLPICSSNCQSCTSPFTCDNCKSDYYIDDSQNCQALVGQPIEIQIDNEFNYAESLPRVAQFSSGGGVIVWQSNLQDGSGFGVYAQLIGPDGVLGNQIIQVNLNTKNSQFMPDVTILPNNNVIIVWADGDINTESELYFQIFDQELNRIGTPTFIDYLSIYYLQSYDRPIVVQGLKNNEFVVAWIFNSLQEQSKILVSLFDNNGVLKKLNQITNFDSNNEVVINSNGLNFVIVYQKAGQLTTTFYNLDGLEQATNSYPIFGVSSPSITSNQKQEYIICWSENQKIRYQLFDSNLNQQGSILEVESLNTKPDNPDITALSNGFVIVWENWDLISTRSRKLRIQIFDINGVSLGASKEVNTITIHAKSPQISTLNNDKFMVIWDGFKQISDSKNGIFMMKFGSDGSKELIDGSVCPKQCKSCASSTSCIKCADKYQLIDGLCVPECSTNCNKCSIPSFCDLCQDGFKLDPSGQCSTITSNLLPEDALLATPLDELPSFSSSITIGQSDVLIYSGTVTFDNDSYYLKINLQLVANTNQHEFLYQVKLESLSSQVLSSNVIIKDDNIIQIYYIELIEKQSIEIKLITISYELIIIEQVKSIDSIPYTLQQRNYEDFVTYLFYQNSQYYVIYSNYSQLLKYEVYQYRISKEYKRNSNPERILEIQRQIRYEQICFSSDSIVIIELNKNYLLRSYQYNLEFLAPKITENQFTQQLTIYAQSFIIKRLHNNNFVISWRTGSTQSLSSKNQLYYTILNSDILKFTDYQVVTNSNGILENPQIIVLQNRFAIIWNNFISITYSQLSISFYEESGIFISETKQLNTISNNIKQYFARVINVNQIAINWLSSYTTINLKIQYQYYYLRVTDENVLLPSNTLTCLSECATCQNEYTCLTCKSNYAMNPKTYKCEPLCPETCLKCSSPTVCSVCKEGYSLKQNNECEKNPCKETCSLCNTFQHCLECPKNFYQSQQDMTQCIGTCGPNCADCKSPPVCQKCEDSYYWSKENTECMVFEDVIIGITQSDPLIATFPNGDYVQLWSEEGSEAGVYFQMYKKNGQKIGFKTKVNMDENGTRRLLQSVSSTQNIKTLFSDIATFDQDFVILWVDQIVGDMKVKLKKFDINGQAMGNEVQIAELPKQDLNSMAAPCIIKKTPDNNFVIGFFNQVQESVNKSATMFLQSFSKTMKPIGEMQQLSKADASKTPIISSDEDGVISIVFASEGATFITQITTQGNIVTEPQKVDDGKAFKSTNLKNKFVVFVFEAVSTNVSPPQYILSYQIMNLDKILSEAKIFANPSYGEEDPYITGFGTGFIIAWRTVDKSLNSKDIIFQIFDSDGQSISNQTQVKRQGSYPKNPGVQILNDQEFYITWTASDDKKKDNLYLQLYNKDDLIIQTPIVDDNSQSIICPLNCLSCLSNTVCENCASGYYVENNFCQIDCGIHCLSCSIPNQCDECMLGYELQLNQTCTQIQCEAGYTLTDDMECILTCPPNCNQCQSNDKCLICEEDYNLFKGKCTKLNLNPVSQDEDIDALPYYYIIIICLAATCLVAFIAYSIWKYKKQKQLRQERYQQRQVIDERENTALDSRIN